MTLILAISGTVERTDPMASRTGRRPPRNTNAEPRGWKTGVSTFYSGKPIIEGFQSRA